MTAEQYIRHLRLHPHPEGGFYVQSYRSPEHIPLPALPSRFTGSKVFATAIYYLLECGDFSAFHKIKSDECWHFYAGGSLCIHVIQSNGDYYVVYLGSDIVNTEVFQCSIPAGAWFAVEPAPGTTFGLAGCTVAPGFDFEDFEMANKKNLQIQFPQHHEIIDRLCRE
jgi:predicted cupin superfamily sugar epimerase